MLRLDATLAPNARFVNMRRNLPANVWGKQCFHDQQSDSKPIRGFGRSRNVVNGRSGSNPASEHSTETLWIRCTQMDASEPQS